MRRFGSRLYYLSQMICSYYTSDSWDRTPPEYEVSILITSLLLK